MRYYIILQPSIRSMGGEEMYTRNKVIAALGQGYEPVVFHSGIGDKFYIEDLRQFDQYQFDAFRYEWCVVAKWQKCRLLKRMKTILQDIDEDSVIESHEIIVAEWGEWLAQQLGIHHFAFMLLEHNILPDKSLYDFFRFKYDRHELAGIIAETIPNMFVNFDNNVEGRFLKTFCNNVYEDIPCPEQYKVKGADYTIGSIGRTNKQYVPSMIKSIVRFAHNHSDKIINVLYVGGSMDKGSEKFVKSTLSAVNNIRLTFTGMMYPLSVTMIRQMDVCIASSGSCATSANCGVPTISLDGNDSQAIGIFQKTTPHSLFRDDDEPPLGICDLLEDVLVKHMYQKEDKVKTINIDFTTHWEFIEQMEKKKEYYNLEKIKLPLKQKFVALILGYMYGLSHSSIQYKIIYGFVDFFAKKRI